MKVQGKSVHGFVLQNSEFVGGAMPAGRDAGDVREYVALPLYAVRRPRAVRAVPPYSARHVFVGAEDPPVLDRL